MIKLDMNGFEGQNIEVKPPSFFSGAQLLVNGSPAEKGPKRGQMCLRKNDGSEVIASWQPTMMGFDLPKLVVDGEVIEIAKPIKWYEMIWSAFPLLIIFVGGLIGGVVGFIGFALNAKVFRSKLNTLVKFLLTAGISILAVVVYFVLAMLFYAVTG